MYPLHQDTDDSLKSKQKIVPLYSIESIKNIKYIIHKYIYKIINIHKKFNLLTINKDYYIYYDDIELDKEICIRTYQKYLP